MSEPVRQAIDYINTNLSGPLLVQDIAAVVSMSTSYFYQRFVQETGMTPADFRTRQRVQMAKGLLQEKELSITQIAYQFGFSTSQYFATVFKRYTGTYTNCFPQAAIRLNNYSQALFGTVLESTLA